MMSTFESSLHLLHEELNHSIFKAKRCQATRATRTYVIQSNQNKCSTLHGILGMYEDNGSVLKLGHYQDNILNQERKSCAASPGLGSFFSLFTHLPVWARLSRALPGLLLYAANDKRVP
jgi:hypothetical protein